MIGGEYSSGDVGLGWGRLRVGWGVGAGLFNLGSLLRAAVAKLGPLCGLDTEGAAGGGL